MQPQLTVVAPTVEAELEPGQVVGSYRIESVLGEGTMGRVYLGRHVALDRPAALKVLHPRHTQDASLVQRFFQEARLVNRIAHEHIVEVFDFVESLEPPMVYGVMELLNGDTLSARLAAHALTLDVATRVCQQIALALQAAHAVGVVHRDLKPDNVFLIKRGGRDDYVKVLDFGVAKLAQPAGPSAVISTNTGSVIGTPRYMAPEQAAGLEVDARSDIYALGTILYEMLAGRVPFESLSFGQLAADVITKPPPPLPERSAGGEVIPPTLRDLVTACLQKQPEARPATMTSVETWLGRALTAGAAELEASSAVRPRRFALIGGAVAAVAGMAALAAWYASSASSSSAPLPPAPVVVERPAPAPAPVAPQPSTVSVMITTTPAGARLINVADGRVLGTSPFTGALPRSATPLSLRIEVAGYEPLLKDVSLAADATIDVSLTRLRAKGRKQNQSIKNGVIDPF